MKDLMIVATKTHFADFDGFAIGQSHGPMIEGVIRKRLGVQEDSLCWLIELTRTLVIQSDGFSIKNMRRLRLPAFGSSARIAMHCLARDCEGLSVRLELFRGVLAINGLLWDNRIVHIRDIAA